MNTLVYLILQVLNGEKWNPEFGVSKNYKNWIAVLDTKTCLVCRFNHGKIWLIIETPNPKPPVHYNCRCEVKKMITVKAGTATISKYDGADWWLKTNDELPSVYISYLDAKKQGWNPLLGDLHSKCPNKLITNGVYKNRNGHLPNKKNRVWYEADINYKGGYRNNQRIVYSNDGLIFVTYDHYQTFFEIV